MIRHNSECFILMTKCHVLYEKNCIVTNRPSGGTSTYIESYIRSRVINNILSDLVVLAVQINLKEKLTICTIYL